MSNEQPPTQGQPIAFLDAVLQEEGKNEAIWGLVVCFVSLPLQFIPIVGIIVRIIGAVMCASGAYKLAKGRGASPNMASGLRILAFFFPPIGVGIAFAVGPAKKPSSWVLALIYGSLCCICLPIPAAILFPVFAQAKYAAKKTTELSNNKQVALSIIMYSGDYDDHLPPDISTTEALKTSVHGYYKVEAIFDSLNSNGGSVIGNAKLNGKSFADIAQPRITPLNYDSKPWAMDQAILGYADGHAKAIPWSEFKQELALDPTTGR